MAKCLNEQTENNLAPIILIFFFSNREQQLILKPTFWERIFDINSVTRTAKC